MAGPRPAHGLRPRKKAADGLEADTERTVDTRRMPARPGTVETGRPSPQALGAAERDDLEQIGSGDVLPPEDQGPSPQGPAAEEHGRMDRKELTGQRAQDEERVYGGQTDTQGGQPRGRKRIPDRR